MKGYSLATNSALAVTKRDPEFVAKLLPLTRKRTTRLGKRSEPTLYPATLPCGCEGPYSVCEETRSHDTAARLGQADVVKNLQEQILRLSIELVQAQIAALTGQEA